MEIKEFVKVDSKGRITIPTALRLALGIREGMIVMLVAKLDRKILTLIPTKVDEDQRLVKLVAVIKDKLEALLNLLLRIRENLPQFDATSINCISIIRGEIAKCEFLATIPKELAKNEVIKDLSYRLMQSKDIINIEIVLLEREGLEL